MASQEEHDFVKYVDNLERKRTADQNEQLAARLREEWRTTTIAGALFAAVEKSGLAKHFRSLADAFEEGEDSTAFRTIDLTFKVGLITAIIAFVYVVGGIAQSIVGKELVIEKEIVLVEQVTERRKAEDASASSEKQKKS